MHAHGDLAGSAGCRVADCRDGCGQTNLLWKTFVHKDRMTTMPVVVC